MLEYHPAPWDQWVTIVGNILVARSNHAVLSIGSQQLPCSGDAGVNRGMTFGNSGTGTGMDNSIPEVWEQEWNGKKHPKIREREGTKKSIPTFRERESEAIIPGNI